MSTTEHIHPLDLAAEKFGSQAALARAIGSSRSALNQWKREGREVPAEYAPLIEELTGVPCDLLCPSVRWDIVRGAARRAARRRNGKTVRAKDAAHV